MDKKSQDRIRIELLQVLESVVIDSEISEPLRAAMAEAYLAGIIHFQSLLDSHNKDLIMNLKYHVKLLRKKYCSISKTVIKER